MEFLPRTMGTRPRIAVEVRPEGVVAGRADGTAGVLAAVSGGNLREGLMSPGLRRGNVADRSAVSAAVRKAVDGVTARGGEGSKYVTLVVPDASVRVLLLDFDAIPGKAAEALAVVRFRLKKLLPFDAEHAVVSYQVMSSGRDGIRVLAVAMPCDVLAEYEDLVSEAGYTAGSVLPSTLAALAGLDGGEAGTAPVLVVNAGANSVTTAIVDAGVLLLHRTVDLGMGGSGDLGQGEAGSGGEPRSAELPAGARLEGAGRESSAGEYDRKDAESAVHAPAMRYSVAASMLNETDEAVKQLNEAEPVSTGREVTQAVSVAAAYFEDTLGGTPPVVIAAGTMGAARLGSMLAMYGMDGLQVREMVGAEAIGAGASTSPVPRGWLAGVRGALRS